MSLLDLLWPRRRDAAALNPDHIFDNYVTAVGAMEAAAPSIDDEKLLAQSWKIFDNEAARRTSIDARAAALMPAISLTATLVTGLIAVLKDATISIYALAVILATLVLALVYLLRTMFLLFVIHGQVFGNTPDPSDLPTPAAGAVAAAPSPYDRGLASKIMRYTISNYRINNVQVDALHVAQRSFRNAIWAIAAGGTIAGIMILGHSVAPSPSVVKESDYDQLQVQYQQLQAQNQQLQAQNQQLQTQNQQLQEEVRRLQREASFVEAGDLLFSAGGYQLSPAGEAELRNNIVPKLTDLQNAKIVVYGYTDNVPVGPQLKRAGIKDNLTLSSQRAGSVVTYLISQGVKPNIISAKGFGNTHPVAPNDTPADRAKNRRIVITVQGPGAAGGG